MLADKSGLRKRDSLITPIKEIKPKSDSEVQKMMARFGIGIKKRADIDKK